MTEERVKAAVEAADEVFWAEIVKHFPEVTSGGMTPAELFFWGNVMERAVKSWLEFNLHKESA